MQSVAQTGIKSLSTLESDDTSRQQIRSSPRPPEPVAQPVTPQKAFHSSPSSRISRPDQAHDDREQDGLNWSRLAFELELDAIARQVVLNSVVQSYQPHRIQLACLAEMELMLKPEVKRQIKQAIESRLGLSFALEFTTVPTLEAETPHQADCREQEQRRQQAVQEIRQHPLVQACHRLFGASLVEQSVRKSESGQKHQSSKR